MISRRSGPGPLPLPGGAGEAWYDENAGPIVRLYAMTGGRAHPADHEFTVSTLVLGTDGRREGTDLSPEESAILRLCTRTQSVAEIAAHLRLPLGTAAVLVGDLRAAGLLRTVAQPADGHPSLDMMRRLYDGLLAL